LPDRSAAPRRLSSVGIDLSRRTCEVHRDFGRTDIAQFAGAVGVPIARYFIIVGGTLAALLFIAGWCLPTPPAMFADQTVAIDRAVIRIKSARKWPEKVVLDTSQPTMTPPPVVVDPSAAQSSVPLPTDEAPDQSNLEAMAQLKPDTRPAAIDHPTLQIKRGVASTARSRRVARGPVTHRRAEMAGGCCQFGWVDNGQTSPNAMSRRHAASSWPMDWPALTGRN
jgi:hypothetical protein